MGSCSSGSVIGDLETYKSTMQKKMMQQAVLAFREFSHRSSQTVVIGYGYGYGLANLVHSKRVFTGNAVAQLRRRLF